MPGIQEFVDSIKDSSLDDQQKQKIVDEFLVLKTTIKLLEKNLFSEAINLIFLYFGKPGAKQDQGYKEIKS